jgi:glycosyltransferase involved in cell wall biosynthesis
MSAAEFLIMPSIWYETFGMVIAEAFASGLPIIASNLGAMAEIVDDGVTGLLFEAGNAEELGEKVEWAIAHPDEMREMGKNARIEFERKYTAESNLTQLITIYRDAINLCEHEARVNE